MAEQTRFYVYMLSRPNDAPFYIGKGTGDRMDQHEREARTDCPCHKCRVIRKVWRSGGAVQKHVVFRTNDEQAALDYEAKTIAQIGLGRLVNVQPGGGKGRLFFYNTPIDKTSESDFVRYLRNVRRTPQETQKELTKWRRDKLRMLRQDWGNLRRQHKFEEAEALMPEIERLRMVLGMVTQLDLGL